MAAMDELHILVGAKTQKLKSEIIRILQSHYPPSGNVHVILLKIKWHVSFSKWSPLGHKRIFLLFAIDSYIFIAIF